MCAHIPNKKGICERVFNVKALDAKQRINFFCLGSWFSMIILNEKGENVSFRPFGT